MGKFIKLSAKKYKTIKDLAEYLVAKKRTISIDEIFDAIKSFQMQSPGLLDGIEYGSRHKTHTNYLFLDKKYPENSQLLNLKVIDKVSSLNLWYNFMLDKPFPKWFWSKSEKSEKHYAETAPVHSVLSL